MSSLKTLTKSLPSCKSHSHLKSINKFSKSCLGLKIFTGRYLQIPEAEMICTGTPRCSAIALFESEYHFQLECSGYREIRHSLFNKLPLPETLFYSTNAEKTWVGEWLGWAGWTWCWGMVPWIVVLLYKICLVSCLSSGCEKVKIATL